MNLLYDTKSFNGHNPHLINGVCLDIHLIIPSSANYANYVPQIALRVYDSSPIQLHFVKISVKMVKIAD